MAADAQDSADPLPDTFAEFADTTPEWTQHALRRWDSRMPADAVAPETAYERSVPVHDPVRGLFATGGHDAPDEVRIFGEHTAREPGAHGVAYLALLIVEHEPTPDVVTCYRVASRYDRSVRAYCRARWQEVGR